MKKQKTAPGTRKVRRDVTGGKRGNGNQRRTRIRRPDPRRIRTGRSDPTLTGAAGLAGFGVYLGRLGVDGEVQRLFGRLKTGPRFVYPMPAQLRLLTDAFAVGETRVFGIEGLASDPLFEYLAGGQVPSIDTLYDDLDRFDARALGDLEGLMATHGLARVSKVRSQYVHMDIDTSVLPIFGAELEGAVAGPNPRFHGRPSFHPVLARIAETDAIVGAQLRPGDTGFGEDDVPTVRTWVARARRHLRGGSHLCVRVDAAGDCGELLRALHEEQVFYVIKAKLTRDLYGALTGDINWKTVDRDADLKPIRQVAELTFRRGSWGDTKVRVIAVRSRERHGKQLPLGLDGLDWTAQVFLTNRVDEANDVAWDYDKRAGIEALIAELKGAWGIGNATSKSFAANHAVLLLKLLTHNLLNRYCTQCYPALARWRTPWRRRVLLRVPGRLSRSGRGRKLHLPPGSPLLE
jgi:hypothetical protein